MGFRLSILDKSPIDEGATASDALQLTLALAHIAENAGYSRYWVAEHHNSTTLASPSPELLIAYLLAQTNTLRIGSGGVMLQHYSPYKVAENFNLLASLAPGRVDLGVGRAPGGLPLSTQALQLGRDLSKWPGFEATLVLLNDYLNGAASKKSNMEEKSLHATPLPQIPAQRFLLGASIESALLAARLGWQFVYAGHFNDDAEKLARVLSHYRDASGGISPLLATTVIVAADSVEARRRAEALKVYRLDFEDGQGVNLGSPESIDEYLSQLKAVKGNIPKYHIDERTPHVLHGTAIEVEERLEYLHRELGIGEFFIDTPIDAAQARFDSIRLLAEHYRDRHNHIDKDACK